MAVPKNDTYKDYARYAEYFLNMMVGTTDKKSRRIKTRMAAEWRRPADAIRRPWPTTAASLTFPIIVAASNIPIQRRMARSWQGS